MVIKRAYVEILNQCNWHCPFCPQAEGNPTVMSPQIFEEIITLLNGKCEEVTLHLLGEPLMHPEVKKIFEILELQKMPLFLVTNGTLLTPEILSLTILKQINISLHGLPFNELDQDRYLKNLLEFCHQAVVQRAELYINLRLWNLKNETFNEKIRHLLEERFSISINPNVEVKLNKGKKLIGRLYLHHDTQFEWPSLDHPLRSESEEIYCHALSHQIAIRANGEVTACCLDYKGINTLGNFHDVLPRLDQYTTHQFRSKLFNNSNLCKRCQYSKERCRNNV